MLCRILKEMRTTDANCNKKKAKVDWKTGKKFKNLVRNSCEDLGIGIGMK